MELRRTLIAPLARLEGLLAAAYARVLWSRMVRRAERLRSRSATGGRVAVIDHPMRRGTLLYIDRGGFREFRRRFKVRRGVGFGDLLAGAWYYTAGRDGTGGLSGADYEARRRVFLRSAEASVRRLK